MLDEYGSREATHHYFVNRCYNGCYLISHILMPILILHMLFALDHSNSWDNFRHNVITKAQLARIRLLIPCTQHWIINDDIGCMHDSTGTCIFIQVIALIGGHHFPYVIILDSNHVLLDAHGNMFIDKVISQLIT